jgi:hypothetical protein
MLPFLLTPFDCRGSVVEPMPVDRTRLLFVLVGLATDASESDWRQSRAEQAARDVPHSAPWRGCSLH